MVKQPMHIGIKVFATILLTVVVFAAFTSCKKKITDENNTVDGTQNTSEYTTLNPTAPSDADSQIYGFEEDEDGTTKNDGGSTADTTASKNGYGATPSESSDVSGNKPHTTLPESSEVSGNKPHTTTPETPSKNETESENEQGSLPPKSDSQKGEWGASVNN